MRWKALAVLAGLVAALAGAGSAQPRVTLQVAIAADVNVVEAHNNYLGVAFAKNNPGVTVHAVGTGTGEAASRAVYTKIKAQADAGRRPWDLDVALVSMRYAAQMVRERLLHRFVSQMQFGRYVVGPDTEKAFGVEVKGYVVPMFKNQIAIAYNPAFVQKPPRTFAELEAWVRANPRRFGYNGIKGGVSGIGFVMAWVYYKTGRYDLFTQGPYDRRYEPLIRQAVEQLREFNRNVVLTSGNAGTLDALNRGEIWMGAVWVDQLVAWKNEGRMNPDITPVLIAPGLPIYPLYLVVPREAANREWGVRYVDFVANPQVQAKVIVEQFGWYPGIDPNRVMPLVSPQARALLFKGVTPEDLARYSLQMPLGEYYDAILLAYEEIVR
ncbi:MAG: extracellular solute-binding protein [Armatimonadota bacterium]|nr:extracellular solute-binding protein [Armatimonadota bacterium]MDW8157105.1 extracellular solute-binding protein [Armatimonadota bacterium]